MITKAVAEYRNDNKKRILKKFENKSEYNELKKNCDAIDVDTIDVNPSSSVEFIENPFYCCFDKIVKYIRNKEGGLKEIKPLINQHSEF
ncbi:unnamed protein product [Blepharisma stoltei]|uniref:Uncharacterized protein n=1 Tax=Blepharisma stoltei TaxID=1481888 RepID=A0AAU9JR73_9CILI|nr:unnamed protein product [Blepharisma stoltei]